MNHSASSHIQFPDCQADSAGTQRLVPHFFILGERKCGTSSLFRYLMLHRQVLPGIRKEPNFFAGQGPVTASGFREYLKNFPPEDASHAAELIWPELDAKGRLYEEAVRAARHQDLTQLTGDASANTFHEAEPEDVFRFLPAARLILVFRDPVERAFSHHRMFLRFQEEGRDLGRKILSFEAEMEKELKQPGEFLMPGLYLNNLRRWDAVFPRSQRLVLWSDDLARKPQVVLNVVFDHLGIPREVLPVESLAVRHNQAPPAQMPTHTRQKLRQFYAAHHLELTQYLGCSPTWEK